MRLTPPRPSVVPHDRVTPGIRSQPSGGRERPPGQAVLDRARPRVPAAHEGAVVGDARPAFSTAHQVIVAYHGQRSRRIAARGGSLPTTLPPAATRVRKVFGAGGPAESGTIGPGADGTGRGDDGQPHGYRRTETVEKLTRAQCLELMATVPVGRIGVSVRALPVILPVNFVLLGENIVFQNHPRHEAGRGRGQYRRGLPGRQLRPRWHLRLERPRPGSQLRDHRPLLALADIPPRAWAFDISVATRLVRIESSFVSGRRFRHPQM